MVNAGTVLWHARISSDWCCGRQLGCSSVAVTVASHCLGLTVVLVPACRLKCTKPGDSTGSADSEDKKVAADLNAPVAITSAVDTDDADTADTTTATTAAADTSAAPPANAVNAVNAGNAANAVNAVNAANAANAVNAASSTSPAHEEDLPAAPASTAAVPPSPVVVVADAQEPNTEAPVDSSVVVPTAALPSSSVSTISDASTLQTAVNRFGVTWAGEH